MQQLRENTAFDVIVRHGLYVSRRFRAARIDDYAASIKQASLDFQGYGRAWEDRQGEVQEVLADRDALRSSLRGHAREVRRTLLGRADKAEETTPYTLIFPKGLKEYVRCAVEEVQATFKQLRERLTQHLAADDTLRTDLLPRLEADLTAHEQTETTLEELRATVQRARDSLVVTQTGLNDLLVKAYGVAVSLVGKDEAADLFPRLYRKQGSSPATSGTSTGSGDAEAGGDAG